MKPACIYINYMVSVDFQPLQNLVKVFYLALRLYNNLKGEVNTNNALKARCCILLFTPFVLKSCLHDMWPIGKLLHVCQNMSKYVILIMIWHIIKMFTDATTSQLMCIEMWIKHHYSIDYSSGYASLSRNVYKVAVYKYSNLCFTMPCVNIFCVLTNVDVREATAIVHMLKTLPGRGQAPEVDCLF
jgi:hypothetical protein